MLLSENPEYSFKSHTKKIHFLPHDHSAIVVWAEVEFSEAEDQGGRA